MSPLEALRRLLVHLRSSAPSAWATEEPPEIVDFIESVLHAIEHERGIDRARLRLLLAPTGSLQEIAIHNGWSDAFEEIASTLDPLVGS
jgi:hypothetical protein